MVTLSDLVLQARRKADLENSNFIRPDEAQQMVNASCAELHGLLCNQYEDQFTIAYPFTVAAASDGYALPSDFYRLRGVDFSTGGQWVPLRRFNFVDRDRYDLPSRSVLYDCDGGLRYRLVGSQLLLTPSANGAGGSYRLWYIPRYQDLVNDMDPMSDNYLMNYWHEYVTTDAAMKMALKEESSDLVEKLFIQKGALQKRIEEEATNRDAGEPEHVADLASGNWDEGWW